MEPSMPAMPTQEPVYEQPIPMLSEPVEPKIPEVPEFEMPEIPEPPSLPDIFFDNAPEPYFEPMEDSFEPLPQFEPETIVPTIPKPEI